MHRNWQIIVITHWNCMEKCYYFKALKIIYFKAIRIKSTLSMHLMLVEWMDLLQIFSNQKVVSGSKQNTKLTQNKNQA